MRFSIVTPVLNGERFLDQAILSVVSQVGPFSIRYHVQDGGSKDATLEMLTAWKTRLATDFPIGCDRIEFSFATAPDQGVYDAVNRGFSACGDSDIMAWINSDDRFEPGAFVTVADIFDKYLDCDWVTGRPMVIAEDGAMFSYPTPVTPFPRQAIAAGIFDGRTARFIQQEGTFWRAGLWKKAGGLDANFRLAGDFDLWRRFAKHSDLVSVDAVLGGFRMRVGQLSANKADYYAEIDASLSPEQMKTRAKSARRFAKAGFSYQGLTRRYGEEWQRQISTIGASSFLGAITLMVEDWCSVVMSMLP
ncbi:glycosyltransferase [Methylocapsa aurea]|uniref:glycosyltransferase n=1 Tax=Methylocapsa aurea TaxID=663610 RepID=UPI000A01E418|nr:glycosyltransferase [Methylocapsa aurea]